jgi:hypothetical protein
MIVNSSPTIFLEILLTVNPLLVSKSMSLLSLVPLNDKTVAERESCSRICSTVKTVSLVQIHSKQCRSTYNSSQLKSDLASVVSMCFTASASNSSLVLKPFADYQSIPLTPMYKSRLQSSISGMTYEFLPAVSNSTKVSKAATTTEKPLAQLTQLSAPQAHSPQQP